MYLHWNCRKHLHSLCHKLGGQKERCWNALTPKNDNNLCTWVPKLTAVYHIHKSEWKQVVWWCLVVATIVSNKKQVFVVFGGFPLYTGKHLNIYTEKHLDNAPASSSLVVSLWANETGAWTHGSSWSFSCSVEGTNWTCIFSCPGLLSCSPVWAQDSTHMLSRDVLEQCWF